MNFVKSLVNDLALSSAIGFFIFCLACSPAEAGKPSKDRQQRSGDGTYFQQQNRASKTADPYEPHRSRGYHEDLCC